MDNETIKHLLSVLNNSVLPWFILATTSLFFFLVLLIKLLRVA